VITLSLLHPVKQTPVQVWSFPNEPVVRIGRSSDNQVVLYSAVVSRYHVELRQSGSTWEVVNIGTNGTYVDGKRVTQLAIADGAVIRLARSGPNIQVNLGVARSEFAQPAAAQPTSKPAEEMPLTTSETD
jgi:pSer/pThr/pTyr-binding forkhead associated (FHA) protein